MTDGLDTLMPYPGYRELASLSERFWSKVDDSGDGCWPWLGTRKEKGYGRFAIGYRQYQAHRVAYTLAVGPIPDGLQIDHLCRNRACCNPAHMEVVTNRENTLRGETVTAANARKTHCPQGHAYTPGNLRPGKPYRACRTCDLARKRVSRHEGATA